MCTSPNGYECTATVEKNGFLNYNFSTHNHIGYVSTGATSTAAPLTSGLAGLLIAINPYLSNVQVRNIINETCDNIDAANPAYIGKLGSGRINAYQAVLLGAAYANKSQYAGALSLNNTRHLDRAGGKVHLIFHSGGEVFYRRSSDNGHSWELTKRLTKGNGSNARESLVAAHDNSVHVVFQHKNDNGTYNVMLSQFNT
ncbi:S8 family serine peptidase [Calditrichota bacterium GD2]